MLRPPAAAPQRGLDPGLEAEGGRQLTDLGPDSLADGGALHSARALGSQHQPSVARSPAEAQLRLGACDSTGALRERREHLRQRAPARVERAVLALIEHGAAFTARRQRPDQQQQPEQDHAAADDGLEYLGVVAFQPLEPAADRRALKLYPELVTEQRRQREAETDERERDKQQKPEQSHQRAQQQDHGRASVRTWMSSTATSTGPSRSARPAMATSRSTRARTASANGRSATIAATRWMDTW